MHASQMAQLITILEKASISWPVPAVTGVARNGASPFQILVATLISLRTRDAVTGNACHKLFQHASSPRQMLALGSPRIARLIHPASFSPTKAKRLVDISHILLEKHEAAVPDTMEALLLLPGVGRKTANLVLVEAFGKPGLCVDTHVHRISNRLGLVTTCSAEHTETVLRTTVPQQYWKPYSELLAVFGQKICTPRSPLCSDCPAASLCNTWDIRKNKAIPGKS